MNEAVRRPAVDLARLERLALAASVVVYLALLPHGHGIDGGWRFRALYQLVEHGRLTGDFYSIVQPILTIPLYLVGRAFGVGVEASACFNALLVLAALAAARGPVVAVVGPDVARRAALAVVALSATPYHATLYYGEVLSTAAFAGALLLYVRGRDGIAAILVVVAVVNTPAAAVGALFVCAVRAWESRRLVVSFLPLAVAAALVGLEFAVRRGSVLASGYEGRSWAYDSVLPSSDVVGFGLPFLLGLSSILFSFGKGLAFYAPGLWFAAMRPSRPFSDEGRRFLVLCAALLLGLILVYSKWFAWHGAWFFGPRFFLFAAVPASLLLAHHCTHPPEGPARKAVALLLVAASTWIGVLAGAVRLPGAPFCAEQRFAREHECWYVLDHAPLAWPLVGDVALDASQAAIALWTTCCGALLAAPLVVALARDARRRST